MTDNVTTDDSIEFDFAEEENEQSNDDGRQPENQPEVNGQGEPENGEPKTDAEVEKSKPKRSRAEQRINELVAKNKALEQQLAQQDSNGQPETTGEPKAPDINDFDLNTEEGLQDWLQARDKHQTELENWRFEQRFSERERQQTQQAREQSIKAEIEKAVQSRADFSEVVQRGIEREQDTPLPIDLASLPIGAEQMPDLLYTLSKDEELYYDIAQSDPASALLKIGATLSRIEGRKTAKPQTKVSNAPPPPKHTKANAPITKNPEEMTDEEWYMVQNKSRK